MMQLLKVELSRLLARRLFKGLSLLLIVAFSIGGVAAFIASDNSPEALAEAQASIDSTVAQCMANNGTDHMDPGIDRSDPAELRAFCEEEAEWMTDPRFDYTSMEWQFATVAFPFIVLGWLMGASFIGAEWQHRTLTTTLTWEPRRGRVIAAKATAVAIVTFVWILVAQALFAAAMYPAAAFEGTVAGVDSDFWLRMGGLALRVAGAASIGGLLGFSLATVGKNTAAAFGGGFLYLTAVEGLVRGLRPSWVDWLIGDNLSLILIGSEEVNHLGHSEAAAALLLLAYTLALLGAAAVIFKRREMA